MVVVVVISATVVLFIMYGNGVAVCLSVVTGAKVSVAGSIVVEDLV